MRKSDPTDFPGRTPCNAERMLHAHHLVARAPDLSHDREARVDLWRRLRRRFPQVAACVLMPDHLHLLALDADAATAHRMLAIELRAWTRRHRPGLRTWAPTPRAVAIPDLHHLRRQIRYVHLNPCRAHLVSDPLSWEWSTHRDATGCVANPWPHLPTLARCFPAQDLAAAIHRYVSSDPSVAVAGTPPLRTVSEPVAADVSRILRAAAVALRVPEALTRGPARTLSIHVAEHLNLRPDPAALGITSRAWCLARRQPPDPAAIAATLRILSDRRCRP